jgi:hypothetical protein
MHVVSINWANDDFRDVALLRKDGLQVVLDTPPDSASISASTFIVTLEVPLSVINGRATAGALPHLSLILDGTLTVVNATLHWAPTEEAYKQLLTILNPDVFAETVSTLRMRITVKGFALSSATKVGNPMHLDGQALGQRGALLSQTQQPRLDLVFPSGLGVTASDFESWFFLTLPVPTGPQLVGIVVDPIQVQPNRGGRGVVTITPAAPANGTVVMLSTTEPNLAQLPASVTVPSGATSTAFSFQTKPPSIKTTISIVAKLNAITQSAALVLEGVAG